MWWVCRGSERMYGQPDCGFDGPGKAYLWYRREGESTDRLGDDTFIMDDAGARPCGHNTKGDTVAA